MGGLNICVSGWDMMCGAKLKPNLNDNVHVKIVDNQPYFHLYDLISFASSEPCNGKDEWGKLPLSVRFKFAGATRENDMCGKPTLCIDLQGALRLIRTLPIETTDEHREQACAFICKYFEYSQPRLNIEAQPNIEDDDGLERRLNLIRRAYDDYIEYASGAVPDQARVEFASLLLQTLTCRLTAN
jgi:hypothetical protein